jgi:type IV pilus assembly protein PilY1
MPTPTRKTTLARVTALATLCALMAAAPLPAGATVRSFAAGSLIIPTQMEYQSDCAMVSAYGLVYMLLYKNTARIAAGLKPITVYWVIETKKRSHHRCDTSTNDLPNFSLYNDNDGCDFAIQEATGTPVQLVDYTNAVVPLSVYSTTYNNTTGASTRSATANVAIDASKTVMKYSGGLWVIDAVDRDAALALFKTDADFANFRTSTAVTCTASGGQIANGTHQVAIHSARIGFTAPVAKIINQKPPLIALVGAKYLSILVDYLKNAGLDAITGPGGQKAGGVPGASGIIYDVLDPLTDFLSTPTYTRGVLNTPDPKDATRTYYQVLWAPHWEAGNTGQGDAVPADGDPGDDVKGDGAWTHGGRTPIQNAMDNIAAFSELGNGMFAECASIESMEGSYNPGASPCTGNYQCQCTDTGSPAACVFGTIGALNACPTGTTAVCGDCYSCPSGYTMDASVCGEVKCTPNAVTCPATDGGKTVYPATCGSTTTCYKCDQSSFPYFQYDCNNSRFRCWDNASFTGNNSHRTNAIPVSPSSSTIAATASGASCSAGFTKTCVNSAAAVLVDGVDTTRFETTDRFFVNGLSNTFTGQDCTDEAVNILALPNAQTSKYRTAGGAAISGPCINYHDDTYGPGNTYAQKGNYRFDGISGKVKQYRVQSPSGQPNVTYYKPNVLHFASSRNNGTVDDNNWDFINARHKDGDPGKGMVVYLAGHSYANSPGGNRVVLNTLLNLGFDDTSVELARSEPVGYVTWGTDPVTGKPVVAAQTVFQGTYEQHPPPDYQDWINYNPDSPKSWRFPFTDGHLRAYDLGSLSTTGQDFKSNALWDAGGLLPKPASRTIFTTLGGSANLGWKKVEVKYTETAQGTCTVGSAVDKANKGICLLSDALSQCNTAGVKSTDIQAGDPTGAFGSKLGAMLQMVRGHCAAHAGGGTGAVIMEPADSDCDDKISKFQRNVARLGGVDHASPAIVGPSPYIGDETVGATKVAWSKRPVVAYGGARDGMLHAFYVSGDPTWTAGGASLPAGVKAGQELWAYLPPGQLCGLQTNDAMVDANINVVDVFADFPIDANGDGVFDLTSAAERPTGVRRWRTLLVAAVGEGGSEIFTMDVTNPLKPALLWRIGGAENHDDRWDANKNGTFADAADHMSLTDQNTYAYTWANHVPSDYLSTSETVLKTYRYGRYDYRNLNRTLGTATGTIWNGRAYRWVAYVTTNSADFTSATPLGYRGVEVFAIDLATGQKQWQWQQRYTRQTSSGFAIADNSIPGRPALVDVDTDGSVDRLYVGDMEGHLWELSASTGKNLNYFATTSGPYASFPLFGTPAMTGTGADQTTKDLFTPSGGTALAQQPLTSPIGIGRFTVVPTTLEPYLKNRVAVAQGTMGVDWAIAPFERGHVFVVPVFPETGERLLPPIAVGGSPDPRYMGIVSASGVWDIQLGVGERVYGMPKIVDNKMFINTSIGSFGGDLTASMNDAGSTYQVTASGNTTVVSNLNTGQKRFGGVLLFGSDLIVTSDVGITRQVGKGQAPGVDTRVRDRYTPTTTKSWEQRPDGTLP